MGVIVGILLGGAVGVLAGWREREVPAQCPLLSSPYVGGIYGALLGTLLVGLAACSSPGTATLSREGSVTTVKMKDPSISIVTLADEQDFDEEVLQAEAPTLVDFWAPWCGPCRAQAPILEQLAGETENLKIVKVNVDEMPALAGRYSVRAIPTLILFDGGRKRARLVGLQSLDDLKAALGA